MSMIGRVPAAETSKQRKERARAIAEQRRTRTAPPPPAVLSSKSKMPEWGWNLRHNLRGPAAVAPPAHRASSRTLGGAYPFLVETGHALSGAYIGENMLSRSAFCFDPWDAYAAGVIRSHSLAIIGVKGVGKSMLAKAMATRMARLGRKIAVPHDPNGEWVPVAEYVGGKSISIGPGRPARLNLLDAGPRDPDLSDEEWRMDLLQYRRSTIRAIVRQLRDNTTFTPVEHTALDHALLDLSADTLLTVPRVLTRLIEQDDTDADVVAAGRTLGHTLRRVVSGDLAGLFDGPSTVEFDAETPMMVVDTSALKGAAAEAQALARLATANWVRRSTLGGNRQQRVIVHEEAAVELLNDVAGGGVGLHGKVEDEKVARHLGTSNWYLLHRIADLDALGDRGSALHSQALGLLADCDTRISYGQHSGEIARSQEVLGWNDTVADRVGRLRTGEGVWQIGQDRLAQVKNICTPAEMEVFRTDRLGGVRA
jgi:hypothetical protein